MLQGTDTHAGYGRLSCEVMAKTVRFCWAKCTTGNDPGVDAQFKNTVEGCKENNIPVGSYHFAYPLMDDPAHPGRGPEEQAVRAFRDDGGLGSQPGDLAHMIDAEWPAPEDAKPKWGLTRKFISEWFRRHCAKATELRGRKIVIYTYPYWWRWLSAGADVSWASEYELVFADYDHPGPGMPDDGDNPSHFAWVSGTWSDWSAWQYSADGSSARIEGINACPIDRQCMRDEATLARLCGLSAVTDDQLESEPEIVHPAITPDIPETREAWEPQPAEPPTATRGRKRVRAR